MNENMSDKNDSSDLSLDISDINQRSNTTETPDSLPLFHNFEKMEGSGSDRSTPARARTMKEYDQQIASLQKENFNLKLRIYFHEEDARKRNGGAKDDFYQLNIELKVEVESLRKELQDKDVLLKKASSALNSLTANHEAEMKALKERSEVSSRSEVNYLREEIDLLKKHFKNKEEEIESANESLRKANDKISELICMKDLLHEDKKKLEEEINRSNAELDLIDFSASDKNISILKDQVADYEDELEKKNKLIEQLRCALMVKDVLIEQVESERNEVESKFKDASMMKDSDDEHDDDDYAESRLHDWSRDDLTSSKLLERSERGGHEKVIDTNKYTLHATQQDQLDGDQEKFVLEGFIEKLSNRLKDREDFIKECRKNIKSLEDKCFSLLHIVDELKSGKGEMNGDGENHDDYEDYDDDEDVNDDYRNCEGLESSWSQLYKNNENGDEEMDGHSFSNISHLEWKNVGMLSYDDGSFHSSSRQSSANNNNNQNKTGDQNINKLKKLNDENARLKDRLWVIERQFEEWKGHEKFNYQEQERSLKADLERALEAKDSLEEQCSELEDELFRIKKHFDEFGSFIVDFEDVSRESPEEPSPDFMDRLTGLREVFARQEKLLKEKQEIISNLEAENVECKNALERHGEEADSLKRTMEEKIKTLNDNFSNNKTSLMSDIDKLNQEILAKEQELRDLANRSKAERDSLAERCKELEVVNLQLNENLTEAGHNNDILSKKLATSDALGQQLNNLLKEGGDITMQLNTKAEQLSRTNEDLVFKLKQLSDVSSVHEEEIRNLKKTISEKESLAEQLTADTVDKNDLASQLEAKLTSQKELIDSYESKISRQEILIRELNEKLSNMCSDIRDISRGVGQTRSHASSEAKGVPGIELENIYQKKEQLLNMMHEKREVSSSSSGKDNLIGQWCELVCTIEKEWKNELVDIKAMENKWQVILLENQTLMSERNDMECKIKKLNAIIQELQAKLVQCKLVQNATALERVEVQGEASLNSRKKNQGLLHQEIRPDRFYLQSLHCSENNSEGNAKILEASQATSGEFKTLHSIESSCNNNNFEFKMESKQEPSLLKSESEAMTSEISECNINDDAGYECQLKNLREEVDTCNDIISHLKEQIALNTETSETSGKLKFNPDIIIHLVRKLRSYKVDLSTRDSHQPMPTSDGKESNSQLEVKIPSKGLSEELRGSDISEKKMKITDTIAEDVSVQKKHIQSVVYNSRLSFSQLRTIPPGQGEEMSACSNRATFASIKEIEHPSFSPDFDSTHLDDFLSSAQECDFKDARENILVDMLAESEGRNNLMKTRLEELLMFLKKILKSQGGVLDKEVTDFLDETEGILANMSQWFQERNSVLESSMINLEDSFARYSLVGRNSIVSRPSLMRGIKESRDAETSSTDLELPKPDSGVVANREQDRLENSDTFDEEIKKRRSEEIESEVLELQARLERTFNERTSLEHQLESNKSEMRSLRQAVAMRDDVLQSKMNGLQTQLEALMSENESLKEAAIEAERKLKEEIETLAEQLQANVSILEEFEMSARTKEDELKNMEMKMLDLELEIVKEKESAAELIKGLEASVENLNSELERARETSQQNSSVIEKLNKDLEMSAESTQEYKYHHQKMSEDHSRLKKELNLRDRELEDSIIKLFEAEGKVAEFQSTVESLNHQIEILFLEKKSLEKLLADERQAVKSTLFGGMTNELDSSKSSNLRNIRNSISMHNSSRGEKKDASGFNATLDETSLSVGCSGCTKLEDEMVAIAEERDALLRKVMELSRKSSILTSEVVCHKENLGMVMGEVVEYDLKVKEGRRSVVHCDHSGFLAEIENLKRQIETMQQQQKQQKPPSNKIDQAWGGVGKTEIIEQINKTRKVLALTSMNLKTRGKNPHKDQN